MEVVGAASAIITVAQISASLVSICYDYQRSWHSSWPQLKAVFGKVAEF